jgi:hypothetical protein
MVTRSVPLNPPLPLPHDGPVICRIIAQLCCLDSTCCQRQQNHMIRKPNRHAVPLYQYQSHGGDCCLTSCIPSAGGTRRFLDHSFWGGGPYRCWSTCMAILAIKVQYAVHTYDLCSLCALIAVLSHSSCGVPVSTQHAVLTP